MMLKQACPEIVEGFSMTGDMASLRAAGEAIQSRTSGLTKENKKCTHAAFTDLETDQWALTGAKLLGMHETVSSPKEYRSHLPGLFASR
jgi:hypothetical protein